MEKKKFLKTIDRKVETAYKKLKQIENKAKSLSVGFGIKSEISHCFDKAYVVLECIRSLDYFGSRHALDDFVELANSLGKESKELNQLLREAHKTLLVPYNFIRRSSVLEQLIK